MSIKNIKYHRHLTTIDLDEEIVYFKKDMSPLTGLIYNDGEYLMKSIIRKVKIMELAGVGIRMVKFGQRRIIKRVNCMD